MHLKTAYTAPLIPSDHIITPTKVNLDPELLEQSPRASAQLAPRPAAYTVVVAMTDRSDGQESGVNRQPPHGVSRSPLEKSTSVVEAGG